MQQTLTKQNNKKRRNILLATLIPISVVGVALGTAIPLVFCRYMPNHDSINLNTLITNKELGVVINNNEGTIWNAVQTLNSAVASLSIGNDVKFDEISFASAVISGVGAYDGTVTVEFHLQKINFDKNIEDCDLANYVLKSDGNTTGYNPDNSFADNIFATFDNGSTKKGFVGNGNGDGGPTGDGGFIAYGSISNYEKIIWYSQQTFHNDIPTAGIPVTEMFGEGHTTCIEWDSVESFPYAIDWMESHTWFQYDGPQI